MKFEEKKNEMNNLDNLIRLAKIVAKPWCICTWVLSVLLLLSLGINAYLVCNNGISLDLYAENNSESNINQTN